MKLIKKIKQFFTKKTNNKPRKTAETASISKRLMQYLDAQNWHYEHHHHDSTPMVHHLVIAFSDRQRDWSCVLRINEKIQLVSLFGVLPNSVPHSHFAPMLMAISVANIGMHFGSIELDPTDGIMHAKISFDAEFTHLTDQAISNYLHAVSSLTEFAQGVYDEVMGEDSPSLVTLDYLEYFQDKIIKKQPSSSETLVFFEPTEQYQ